MSKLRERINYENFSNRRSVSYQDDEVRDVCPVLRISPREVGDVTSIDRRLDLDAGEGRPVLLLVFESTNSPLHGMTRLFALPVLDEHGAPDLKQGVAKLLIGKHT